MEYKQELTFGQKAVGLTFNPSGDETVTKLKQLYAEIIDIHNDARVSNGTNNVGANRHHSVAITDAETAQMRSVKAATWKD